MKYSFVLAAAAVAATASAQGEYSQCGGKTWTGSTSCPPGWSCIVQNPWYSQCLIPSGGSSGGSSNSTSTPCEESSTSTTPAATTLSTLCSGESGSTSTLPSYSTPAGSPVSSPAGSPASSLASTPASSMPAYSTPATTTPAASSGGDSYPTSSAPPAASSSASTYPISGGNGTTGSGSGTQFGGVNIAGCDFGCGTDGTCTLSSVDCPVLPNGGDGAGQMSHFVTNDKMNIFRLPVAWQFLVNDQCGGPLDSTNFPIYDGIVQSCLKTGASCIIDIHNYARWNGAIVGQGGPADSELADVWSQLATKYATEKNIIFGIMNEPHDLPDVPTWANTVQASVTAIRKAGATSQIILLPGDGYTGAGTFISSGSLAALQKVTNLDGSTTNLVFDVHQYLDSDGSGTSPDCTRNNIDTAFEPLAAGLRAIKRQALLSETGGGSTSSCEQYLCQQIQWLGQNTDVFLGYVGWAAGSFGDPSQYPLSLTPTNNGGSWTDTPIMSQCLSRA